MAVYAPTATYDTVQSPDPVAAAVPAWQYAAHGNFNLDAFADMVPWFVPGQDHVVSDRMPGVIIFAIPFYWALPTGSEPTMVPGAVAAAVAAAGAMTLLHVLLRRLVTPSAAVGGALLAGVATSTWTVSANGPWPHGVDQLCLTAALWAVSARAWWASGPFFGFAVLTRPPTAVVAAVVGLAETWRARSLGPALAIATASLAGLAAVVAYNVALFGEVAVAAGYFRRDEPLLPPSSLLAYGENVAGTLVSPDRGILVLSPLLLALLLGLGRAWRAAPGWARSAALAGVVYMLVHLALNRFSGGDNFYSYRLPLEMLTLAAPLLAVAWREWTSVTARRRRWFVGLAGVSVLVHALGAIFWTPTFHEASPWTNFKVAEAVDSGGLAVLPVVGVVAGATVLAMVLAGRQTAGTATPPGEGSM
jgi:alpha-1,2-mannosyltransferase